MDHEGKFYLAIFEEKSKRPVTEVVLTELGSGASEVGLPFDSANDAAKFLGVAKATLSNRKTMGSDKPIKAKAKGIEGKLYRATFSTLKVP